MAGKSRDKGGNSGGYRPGAGRKPTFKELVIDAKGNDPYIMPIVEPGKRYNRVHYDNLALPLPPEFETKPVAAETWRWLCEKNMFKEEHRDIMISYCTYKDLYSKYSMACEENGYNGFLVKSLVECMKNIERCAKELCLTPLSELKYGRPKGEEPHNEDDLF